MFMVERTHFVFSGAINNHAFKLLFVETLKEKNKMKRMRKKITTLDLIIAKYSLFTQHRERIRGSR